MKNLVKKNLVQFMSEYDNVKYKNLDELLEIQQEIFEEFFVYNSIHEEQVILTFNSQSEAQMFYLDCQFGNRFLNHTNVYYDITNEKCLILKPVTNIMSLIHPKQYGLKDISKLLNLNFKVHYEQCFTQHKVEFYCVYGEIINLSCELNIFTGLPWLSIGKLSSIFTNEKEFNLLKPTINYIQGELI